MSETRDHTDKLDSDLHAYFAQVAKDLLPLDLEERAVTAAFSRKRRPFLKVLTGGGLLIATAAAVTLVAISTHNTSAVVTPATRTAPKTCLANTSPQMTASELLVSAQQAMDCAASYKIKVQGHNFVLPQWGGVDSGTVAVAQDGTVTAKLDRTGDGVYSMVFINNQTYFQRTSCPFWQRVPGGGSTVLSPFLLAKNDSLTSASQATIVSKTNSRVVVSAEIDSIGPGATTVTIAIPSGLPTTITWKSSADNGSNLTWYFTSWEATSAALPPPGSPSDQGPGGNPC